MKHLIYIFVFILASEGWSQNITAKAFVPQDHAVVLRFAPNDKFTFELGLKNGYVIERARTDSGDKPVYMVITTAPLKPLAQNDTAWVELIRKDMNNAFVYQSIHGGGQSKGNTPNEKQVADKDRMSLVLLSADLSVETAKACGFYFKDAPPPGGTYTYRISISKVPGIKPAFIKVDPNQPTVLKEITGFEGKSGDRIAHFSWNVGANRQDYTAYFLERSEDSLNFTRVNKTPYVQLYSQFEKNKEQADYTDSLPQNSKVYYYRVVGLSHFGETGKPTAVVRVKGREKLGVFPVIDSSKVSEDDKVTVYFKMPAGFDLKKLKGFGISRADKSNGTYHTLTPVPLTAQTNSFTDERPMFTNYYRVIAINVDEDSTESYPVLGQLKDKEPPAPPVGLTGKIDTNGIVTLTWKSNSEADMRGYRVFRCNSLNEEFTEVTRFILNSPGFRDSITLQTLTKDVYYTVTAVDKVFNNSRYAVPLLLKRPDRIAPVAPVLISLTHSDTAVHLKWIPSSSDDLATYELFRKSALEKVPVKIKTWSAGEKRDQHSDRKILYGMTYEYTLRVIDESGNRSDSETRSIIFEPGFRGKITDFAYKVDRDNRLITLTWNYPEKEVFSYTIYKYKKGEQPRIWKTVTGKTLEVDDKELYINNIYVYRIKAVLESGIETMLSDELEVNY